MSPKNTLVAFVYLGLVCATSMGNFRVHEKRDAVPQGFISVGPAPPGATISLRLALAQGDEADLIDTLYSVSDPSSAKYGQYLSQDEVSKLVAPKDATKEAVDSWLQANDLTATPLSPAGDWIKVDVPVGKANILFNTEFGTFVHRATGQEVIRAMSYSLPDVLQGHVDLVHPTTQFPIPLESPATQQKRAVHEIVQREVAVASSCRTNETTVACLQELYQLPTTPITQKDNTIGVTALYGNYMRYSWLEGFLEIYRPDSHGNFSFVGIDNGTNPQDWPSAPETILDVEYILGLAADLNTTIYGVGPFPGDDAQGFLDEATALLALDSPPLVLSTSYGYSESRFSQAVAQKVCQAYAQLGVRGTTVLVASGDSGVGCDSTNHTLFNPIFPASCPYVTVIGGTALSSPEQAWPSSGGGFSNYFVRPAYQDTIISTFLTELGSTNAGRFNATSRAYPDIAAKADNFLIWADGISAINGTSASTPTVASVVALLNDRLLAQGRPQLGFLNPWLYANGSQAFTDIVDGKSAVACQNLADRGFDAVEGWDPVTGFGTPRFDKWASALNL